MYVRSISLLILAILAVPSGSSAQQLTTKDTSSDKKAQVQSDNNPAPAPPKENWAAFNDLKTGLHPMTADVVQHAETADFVREMVRVEWRLGDPIDLWIMRPKSAGRVPVVLYLYSYISESDRFRDDGWAKRATADGFAAVGFVSAFANERFKMRPLKQWFISELPEAVGSSVHDVQLIVDYLAARGDMDMDRVGMFGMGSGATIAILAAHADPRIKTLDVLDPWGDWPDWFESTPVVLDSERAQYTSQKYLKSVATFDPLAYLPTLKTPNLRLQQTMSDATTPAKAKERLAAAVPSQDQVVKYQNDEALLKAWKTAGLSGWIKQQMRSQKPQAVAMSSQ
jgi:X-Pro dipeptidyl-peptidase (S15 family)